MQRRNSTSTGQMSTCHKFPSRGQGVWSSSHFMNDSVSSYKYIPGFSAVPTDELDSYFIHLGPAAVRVSACGVVDFMCSGMGCRRDFLCWVELSQTIQRCHHKLSRCWMKQHHLQAGVVQLKEINYKQQLQSLGLLIPQPTTYQWGFWKRWNGGRFGGGHGGHWGLFFLFVFFTFIDWPCSISFCFMSRYRWKCWDYVDSDLD